MTANLERYGAYLLDQTLHALQAIFKSFHISKRGLGVFPAFLYPSHLFVGRPDVYMGIVSRQQQVLMVRTYLYDRIVLTICPRCDTPRASVTWHDGGIAW